jgi:hypothetical protein
MSVPFPACWRRISIPVSRVRPFRLLGRAPMGAPPWPLLPSRGTSRWAVHPALAQLATWRQLCIRLLRCSRAPGVPCAA